jgi:hypothetical protein
MSINEPSKGQPIDYSYISQMVRAINALEKKDATLSSVAKSGAIGAQSESLPLPTKNLVVFTGYKIVSNPNKDSTSATLVSVDFSFGNINFAQPPIVTATTSGKDNPQKVSLGVTNVGSNSCNINVEFREKGIPSVGINLIAIGYAAGV